MRNHRCIQCNKLFTAREFEQHPCVEAASELSQRELLEELLKSGGCSQAFYDAEIAKLDEDSTCK